MEPVKRKRLGEVLVDAGLISQEELEHALTLQKQSGKKLGEVLLSEGYVTNEQIIKVLESQLGIKSYLLSKFYIDPHAVKMIPENICKKHCLVGIEISNGTLLVAMKDPLDHFALEDIKLLVKIPIKPAISSEEDIRQTLERFYSKTVAEKAALDFLKETGASFEAETSILDDAEVTNAPIVRFIDSMIENAVRNHASDIHVEPSEHEVVVRLRVDGVLQEALRTRPEAINAIVSRIKIMSNLNIAEKRVPQDGRINFIMDNRPIDLRVSTLPTTHGEKICMRISDKSGYVLTKSRLGLNDKDSQTFDNITSKPHGVILVTGPTGSGKTSTLYTIIQVLADVKKNIVTLEDPVEYDMQGINQVQLNTKAGLTFASGLRAILRQDPDIVMVGEIRDSETAEIAIRAALTGHLVLSTLHTNDAPGTISRIMDMGVEPFLISSSLIGVIAQRLIRCICCNCKVAYEPDDIELKLLGATSNQVTKVYKGKGCDLCGGSGYKGRAAIFEIMEMNRNLRVAIDKRLSVDELRDIALKEGMSTLKDNCKEFVLSGITSVEELARVTYTY